MKKILTAVLACLLLCLCVTGCSDILNSSSDNSEEISTQEQASTTNTTATTTKRSTTTTTTTATTTTTTTTTATTTTTVKITTTTTQNHTEAMVWIPQSGKKYHSNASCSNMNNPSQVSKSEAISLGYGPCKRCYK